MLDWLHKTTGVEIGATGPLLLRREQVRVGLCTPVRLLYVSDLHFGNRWSRHVVRAVIQHAESCRPDLILLGGDLADSIAGLSHLHDLLDGIHRFPIGAVFGNHDRGAHHPPMCDLLHASHVSRLDTSSLELGGVTIAGAIGRLTTSTNSILCTHDPADYLAARARGVRLTLAGHLHGGQCVLWERHRSQYPGALINRWTLTRHDDEQSTLIVSRGAADTLPFRFRCPREVVLIELV